MKKQLSFRFEEKLLKSLQDLANDVGLTRNALCTMILTEYVKKVNKDRGVKL